MEVRLSLPRYQETYTVIPTWKYWLSLPRYTWNLYIYTYMEVLALTTKVYMKLTSSYLYWSIDITTNMTDIYFKCYNYRMNGHYSSYCHVYQWLCKTSRLQSRNLLCICFYMTQLQQTPIHIKSICSPVNIGNLISVFVIVFAWSGSGGVHLEGWASQ